jgi:hypothetical protein
MYNIFSGEVTLAFNEWWKNGIELHKSLNDEATTSASRRKTLAAPPLSPDFQPVIIAADPVRLPPLSITRPTESMHSTLQLHTRTGLRSLVHLYRSQIYRKVHYRR